MADAAAAILDASRAGGKVLLFGNGGSATDAQHLASDLVGRFERERGAVAAVALTTDSSVIDGRRQRLRVRPRVRAADRGARPQRRRGVRHLDQRPLANVVEGLRAASARGLRTIAMTGRDGGTVGREVDIHINVPDPSTARVQEAHRTLIHAICELVEREL